MSKRTRKTLGRLILQRRFPKESPELDEIARGQKNYDIISTSKDYSGEHSPYWDWAEQNISSDEEGVNEFAAANPDMMSDESDDYGTRREDQREIIREVYVALSPREREVFRLLSCEMSEDEIGSKLGVSRSLVKQCRKRIINKFKKYDTKNPY